MSTTVERDAERQAPPDTYRLMHIYLPWSLPGEPGYPPIGARALCGHVRDTDSRAIAPIGTPKACLVCIDLYGGTV